MTRPKAAVWGSCDQPHKASPVSPSAALEAQPWRSLPNARAGLPRTSRLEAVVAWGMCVCVHPRPWLHLPPLGPDPVHSVDGPAWWDPAVRIMGCSRRHSHAHCPKMAKTWVRRSFSSPQGWRPPECRDEGTHPSSPVKPLGAQGPWRCLAGATLPVLGERPHKPSRGWAWHHPRLLLPCQWPPGRLQMLDWEQVGASQAGCHLRAQRGSVGALARLFSFRLLQRQAFQNHKCPGLACSCGVSLLPRHPFPLEDQATHVVVGVPEPWPGLPSGWPSFCLPLLAVSPPQGRCSRPGLITAHGRGASGFCLPYQQGLSPRGM
ncbi:PREDICTED: uncharacterized protein LOC105982188 [Dipodomys ordii]|uniref:Uncharacterized protein LOC105982188 n=1 Tax=Dipodomys ordii TaxID=10020 RepID=A0A1S3ERY3_DIPOR|nr:PREDICTED: uncharacterized protein LOC105982188 [Dipodomys ordii]